jgi:hypothetical protein
MFGDSGAWKASGIHFLQSIRSTETETDAGIAIPIGKPHGFQDMAATRFICTACTPRRNGDDMDVANQLARVATGKTNIGRIGDSMVAIPNHPDLRQLLKESVFEMFPHRPKARDIRIHSLPGQLAGRTEADNGGNIQRAGFLAFPALDHWSWT